MRVTTDVSPDTGIAVFVGYHHDPICPWEMRLSRQSVDARTGHTEWQEDCRLASQVEWCAVAFQLALKYNERRMLIHPKSKI